MGAGATASAKGSSLFSNAAARAQATPEQQAASLAATAAASSEQVRPPRTGKLGELTAKERAAAAAAVQAGPSKPLEIVFTTPEGDIKVMSFVTKPLGVVVMASVPMDVQVVCEESQAFRLGVQVGWHVTKVNGTDITVQNVEAQMECLKECTGRLPSAPPPRPKSADALAEALQLPVQGGSSPTLELLFDTGSAQKSVVFARKPLGFNFLLMSPIRVRRLCDDSVARRLGMEEGWVLRGIAGQDVAEVSIQQQYKTLKRLVAQLPEVRSMIAPPVGLLAANLNIAGPVGGGRHLSEGVSLDEETRDDGRI